MANLRGFQLQVDVIGSVSIFFTDGYGTFYEIDVGLGNTDFQCGVLSPQTFDIYRGRYLYFSGVLEESSDQGIIFQVILDGGNATIGFYPAGLSGAILGPEEYSREFTWFRDKGTIRLSERDLTPEEIESHKLRLQARRNSQRAGRSYCRSMRLDRR